MKAGWPRWPGLLLPAAILLHGCAGQPPQPPQPTQPTTFASPEQALSRAQAAVERGQWGDALEALAAGRRQFPRDPQLAEEFDRVDARWRSLKPEWEDRLAVVRTRAMLEELALIERLETAEPGGANGAFGQARRRTDLAQQREPLLRCAERQLDAHLELARTCVDLAHRIAADERSAALREDVVAREAASAAAVRDERAERRQAQLRAQLDEAEALLAGEHYPQAAVRVARVLEADPDNGRARALQDQLNERVAHRTRLLTDLADRLYAEGSIAAAIRVWETSFEINPDQPAARERYERARRVQENLERLRQEPAAP